MKAMCVSKLKDGRFIRFVCDIEESSLAPSDIKDIRDDIPYISTSGLKEFLEEKDEDFQPLTDQAERV